MPDRLIFSRGGKGAVKITDARPTALFPVDTLPDGAPAPSQGKSDFFVLSCHGALRRLRAFRRLKIGRIHRCFRLG
jgi:hypothetical protein